MSGRCVICGKVRIPTEVKEDWVECDVCHRWTHVLCSKVDEDSLKDDTIHFFWKILNEHHCLFGITLDIQTKSVQENLLCILCIGLIDEPANNSRIRVFVTQRTVALAYSTFASYLILTSVYLFGKLLKDKTFQLRALYSPIWLRSKNHDQNKYIFGLEM